MNFKFVLYIPFILLFFPAFAFYVPFLNGVYLIFFLFAYFIIAIFIYNLKDIIKKIISIIKNTPLKIYVLFLILAILNSVFLASIRVTTFGITIRSVILQIFLYIIPVYIVFLYTIDKYISYEKVIKLFYTLFWIYMILGLIAYLGQLFNIYAINTLFDFFANARKINFDKAINFDLMPASNYEAFGLPRLDNLSVEPSFYACFIYLFIPLIYQLSSSKNRLYKNLFCEKMIKTTIIPLTWINVILTQSPIFLVLTTIITILFLNEKLKREKRVIYYIYCIVSIFCFSLLFITFGMNLEIIQNTFISRIVNTVQSLTSIEEFSLTEPSLATRMLSFFNQFCLFLKHPFSGVGIGNVGYQIVSVYMYSPLPLTPEMQLKLQLALMSNSKLMINQNVICYLLAENGIFIFLIFIYFHLLLYRDLIKTMKSNSLSKLMLDVGVGLKVCWFSITIWFFYESSLLRLDYMFVYILIICYIYRVKKYYMKG